MRTVLIIILSCFILTTSCSEDDIPNNKTDENGVYVSKQYFWKTELNHGQANHLGRISHPIYYKNNIIIPTNTNEGKNSLSMIDNDTGKLIWEWQDVSNISGKVIIYHHIKYDYLLSYQSGGSWSYCINLDIGKSHWKIQRDDSYHSWIFPDNTNFFFTSAPVLGADGFNNGTMFKCDILTGNLTYFLDANYSGNYVNPRNSIGSISNVTKLPNNDNLYAITYTEPSPNWVLTPYLGLYNAATQEWIYERIPMIETPTFNTGAYWPKIYNNKLYAAVGKNMVCHDLDTGEQIWIKSFPQDFFFSGFIIEDDIIIANNEDTYTYALNPNNGSQIWKTETSGTSGRMSYLNGIVYFVGGSSGKLHAIDVNTGEHVWKLDGYKLDGESFKTNAVYVLPAKNGEPAKVIALTHLNAYCFEAYQ